MTPTSTIDVRMTSDDLLRELRDDVRRGLSDRPRWLSPRWFYDAAGSRLFDEITRLPEYYLYRAEHEILVRHATDIARLAERVNVIELGSGYSTKTLLVLDALASTDSLAGIVTLDVSEDALRDAASMLDERYPSTPLHVIVGDYTRHLDAIPAAADDARRLVLFLGSTIGNLTPPERRTFLHRLTSRLAPGDMVLIGTDLVKDARVLEAAYDDSAGVTARFNRNILNVIAHRLNAQVDVDAFSHAAWWDADNAWVQVELRATRPTSIIVPDLVESTFAAGDVIHTEISAKFTPELIDREFTDAGLVTINRWFDTEERFAVTLAVRT